MGYCKKNNDNHDPENGQFTSGGGSHGRRDRSPKPRTTRIADSGEIMNDADPIHHASDMPKAPTPINTEPADPGRIQNDTHAPRAHPQKIEASIAHLQANAPGRESAGLCARFTANAIEAGFGKVSGNRPADAKDFGPWVKKAGFEPVAYSTWTKIVKATYPPEDYTPQKGDVGIIQPYTGGNPSGHMSMYDGKEWISDYRQTDFWGGRGYRTQRPGYVIYRRQLSLINRPSE